MIDTLVAFGCSNTFGTDIFSNKRAPESVYHAYPAVIAKKLELPNYLNYARAGMSNLEISMKAVDYILENKDKHKNIFVVIGWSGDSRLPLKECPNHDVTANTASMDGLVAKLKSIHKLFTFCRRSHIAELSAMINVINIFIKKAGEKMNTGKKDLSVARRLSPCGILGCLLSVYFFETKFSWFLSDIVKFGTTQLLQYYNIPYLTLPTLPYHDHELYRLLPKRNNILGYDDDGNLIFDMHEKYNDHLANPHHLNKEGHHLLAEFLYQHIITHNLIAL